MLFTWDLKPFGSGVEFFFFLQDIFLSQWDRMPIKIRKDPKIQIQIWNVLMSRQLYVIPAASGTVGLLEHRRAWSTSLFICTVGAEWVAQEPLRQLYATN